MAIFLSRRVRQRRRLRLSTASAAAMSDEGPDLIELFCVLCAQAFDAPDKEPFIRKLFAVSLHSSMASRDVSLYVTVLHACVTVYVKLSSCVCYTMFWLFLEQAE
jgi:hypothetical protein